MASSRVNVEVDGLREARAAVKKAGGSLDDLEKVNRDASEIVQARAIREAPKRTGRLRKFIDVEANDKRGMVVGQARVLPYFGSIHFGDVTRNKAKGLSRKAAQQALGEARINRNAEGEFVGVLTRRTINKTFRRGTTRRYYSRDEAGVRHLVKTLGPQRGGPIKPNLFMYRAAENNETLAAVVEAYEKKAADIDRALSWHAGIF